MGTTSGRTQTDPGVCFHPAYDNSHTQYTCTVNMANCRKKNTATPDRVKLILCRQSVGGRDLVHIKIFLCSSQGVILITVSTIEILAPLLDDDLNTLDGVSEWSHQIGV